MADVMNTSAVSAPALSRPALLIGGLTLLLAGLSWLWMYQGIGGGNRAFILELRAVKLAALVTVGAAVAVSTMLFQTVAANRVLTPSIMGFDALYVLLQTALVAGLGTAAVAALPVAGKFVGEIAVMSVLAALLFGTLLGQGTRDIPRTILTGIILGVMFRSASGLIARVMDPNEYAVVQAASFASFARANTTLLPWAGAICATAIIIALRIAPRLDVLALGHDASVSLGLRRSRMVIGTLCLVAVLVAVSTALVGPVAFFGLIVSGVAHGLARCHRHAVLLPAAALIGAVILVGGQFLFERLLGQQATLSVVVEFGGGLFFLYLLLKGRIR